MTVAGVTIPADAFELGDVFDTDATADIELTRLIPLGTRLIPYFWVETDDREAFEAELRADPRVDSLTRHDSRSGATLYHVDWTTEPDDLLPLLRDHDVAIEQGFGANDKWTFRLRLADKPALQAFYTACRAQDVPLRIEWISGAGLDAGRASEGDDGLAAASPSTDEFERPEPFLEIIENLDEVVWLTDPNKDEILYVNPAYEAVWGRPREQLYREPLSFLDAVHPDDYDRVRDAIERQGSSAYDETYRIVRPDGTRRWIHDRAVPIRNAEGEVYRIAGIARDITERRERERILIAVNEVTRSLLDADSPEEIADVAVETASDVLNLPLVSLYLFDDSAEALRPAARAPEVPEILGNLPTFTGADSIAWNAFVDGETRVYDDIRTAEGAYNPETRIRSELVVPLGDHGVLLVGDLSTGRFDDTDVEFAELLAANTTTALNRIEHERGLERQNERLRELSRLNDTIRSINWAVVNATTSDEIVTTVCERFVENDPYLAAWFGEYWADGRITVHSTAGAADAAVDRDRVSTGDDGLLDELVGTAVRTRAVNVVPQLRTADADEWHERLVEHGAASAAAVPFTAGDALYGVLVLYASRPHVFDEEEITVLGELGQALGRAMRAAEIRHALTAETTVELVFELTESELFVPASGALDCRFSLDGVVSLADGELLYYVEVEDASTAAVTGRAASASASGIEVRRVVDETDDGGLLEVRDSGQSPLQVLVDYGATVRSAVVDGGTARITVEVTPETDVRTMLNGLQSVYPSTELVGKRELDRSVGRIRQFRETLTGKLTEKQLNTLRTAYFAGYFEWPRDSTAEEIADSLGISSSTFHFHLRHALRKLFLVFFERAYDE